MCLCPCVCVFLSSSSLRPHYSYRTSRQTAAVRDEGERVQLAVSPELELHTLLPWRWCSCSSPVRAAAFQSRCVCGTSAPGCCIPGRVDRGPVALAPTTRPSCGSDSNRSPSVRNRPEKELYLPWCLRETQWLHHGSFCLSLHLWHCPIYKAGYIVHPTLHSHKAIYTI